MTILIVAAVLQLQAYVDWVPIGSRAGADWAYNRALVRRAGDVVHTQLRITAPASDQDERNNVLIEVEFSCATRTMTILSFVTISSEGSIVEQRNFLGSARKAVALESDSMEERVRATVC